MKRTFNIKRESCCALAHPLQKGLLSTPGIFGVKTDSIKGEVTVEYTDETTAYEIEQKIAELGYSPSSPLWEEDTNNDHFSQKARDWDTLGKIAMSVKFFQAISKYAKFSDHHNVMDIGCGTGLVGLQIQSLVNKIVFIDNSKGMLDVLEEKLRRSNIHNANIINCSATEITKEYSESDIDFAVTLMAMHHIEDINKAIDVISKTLKVGAELIIGDLVSEDGTFHNNQMAAHNGFDNNKLAKEIENRGFSIRVNEIYSSMKRGEKEYPQFLIIATKK